MTRDFEARPEGRAALVTGGTPSVNVGKGMS